MKYFLNQTKKVIRWAKMKRRLRLYRATEFLIRENMKECRLAYLRSWDQFPDNSEIVSIRRIN